MRLRIEPSVPTVTFEEPHEEFVQGDALLCATLG
jgi:hypothetical protein